MRTASCFFFAFIAGVLPLRGQSPDTRSIGETIADDGMIFLKDGASFFTAPLRFDGKDWLYAGGFAAGTALVMSRDERIHENLSHVGNGSLNYDFWDIPTRYGAVANANILSFATYATGLVIGNDDIRITGRLALEALSYSGVSAIVLRYTFGRSRPHLNQGAWKFNWFESRNAIQSFPSGHTTVAFALSTVLAERIDTWWSRVFFYSVATMTGYARIRNNQHWASDVVFGAGCGLAGGLFVMARERERESSHIESGLRFLPSPNGLRVVYQF